MEVTLDVNGERHVVEPSGRRLLDVLRDDLELLGTKLACGEGACGACAVLLDGRPVNSCLLLAAAAEGHEIVTIEGLSTRTAPTRVQEAFVAEDALQCGYCTPGQIVSATALLERSPQPTPRADPRRDGRQPCRCGAYPKIERAILRAAGGRLTPRLVRTQTEMEGRYEDVWVLVDEADELETWPADAELALVGQPAPRQDGAARAAGRVRYTVDVRLAGMLHAAVLRSPVAHGRVRSLDLDAARAVPGVRAVIGPGERALA